jgi:hypothetical protein
VAFGVGFFDSTLRFDNDEEVGIEMATVSVSGAWLIDERWTVRASFGSILDGTLLTDDLSTHNVEPGAVVALGAEYRALVGEGFVPFVDLSMFFSAAWAETVAANSPGSTSGQKIAYRSTDARLGVRAGWNIGGKAFPYVSARAFGGPAIWEMEGEDVVGSDIYHYQLALGAAGQIGPMGFFVEWSGLGERAVSSGISASF